MTSVIGICGKGGTGKTTLAALTTGYLVVRGKKPVLAVDADPNANLGRVLGASPSGDVGTICDELLDKTRKGPRTLSKPDLLRLGLEEVIWEGEGFDLLSMGRPEGPGCYCYPNQVLRTIIEKIASGYRMVVVDNEAGLEHLSRRLIRRMDLMLVVSDPGPRGLKTAARIRELARELKIKVGEERIVINRAPDEGTPWAGEAARLGLPISGVIPADPLIQEFDARDRSLLELPPESPARRAWEELLTGLL